MIPFSTFKERVQAIAAPENLGENLQALFRSAVVNGLTAVQTDVPCYRDFHVDFVTKSFVRDFCNTDIFTGPRGTILQVYAYKPGIDCKKYFYTRKSTEYIQCWIDQQRCVSTCPGTSTSTAIYDSPYCNYPIGGTDGCLPPYTNGVEDDTWFTLGSWDWNNCCTSCGGEPGERYFAIGPDYQMFLAPRFPCGYVVAVQWEGIKRSWNDADAVFDDEDLTLAIAKFAESELAAKERNWADVAGLKAGYIELTRSMAHRCRRERRLQPPRDCSALVDHLLPMVNPAPDTVSLSTYGDGTPGEDQVPLAPSPNLVALRTGNTLWVDQVWGNNTLGTREREDRPFLTIAAAKGAALSGDIIRVRPGTYNENNLMKAGVNYHFEAGVNLTWTDPGSIASSTTSVAIGLGSKTFTVAGGLSFHSGDPIHVGLRPNTLDPDEGGSEYKSYIMLGTVTSYSGTTLVINCTLISLGGTFSNWIIFGPGWGFFDDRPAGTIGTTTVTGSAVMTYRNSNPANLSALGAILIQSFSTSFFMQARRLNIGAPGALSNNGFAGLQLKDGAKTVITLDELYDTGELWSNLNATDPVNGPGGMGGIYWEKGEAHVAIQRLVVAHDYGIYCKEPPATAIANFYYSGQHLEATSFNAFYTLSASSNYRVWLQTLQIISGAAFGTGVSLIGPGRIYVNAQKISASTTIATTSELWLVAEKLSASLTWVNAASNDGTNTHITCQHYEDSSGSIGPGINNSMVNGGKLFLHGGLLKSGSGSSGLLNHSGATGRTRLIGCTLDATANNLSTNRPCVVTADGLQLQNCVILAAPLADSSIYAASGPKNVRLHGYSTATKIAHANITLNPAVGQLIIDANAGL